MEDALSALCDHIQRQGLHGHLFSDITVCFQNKDYKLHRIILSQSSYFRSLFSGPWKESGKPRVELRIDDNNVTVQGLEIALSFMYGVEPGFTGDNVVGALAAGCFFCMENLCEQCVQFMVQDIREETFVRYQQLSERHCYSPFAERIRDACWTYLCGHATDLGHLLPKLSLQFLCGLLKSDELWMPSESERYKLARRVLVDWKLARTPPSKSSRKSRTGKGYRKLKEVVNAKGHKDEEETSKKPGTGRDEEDETSLRRIRELWEDDFEGFEQVKKLFTGGGIIFTCLEPLEALDARYDFERARMSADVVNDAIWQSVLLKNRILASPSKEEDEEINEEDDEDDEEQEYEDVLDSSDSEDWSSDSDDSEPRVVASGNEATGSKRNLVAFSAPEEELQDGKRRKTTGGFSWAVKMYPEMKMSDFPPFRFGAEFVRKDEGGWSSHNVQSGICYGSSIWNLWISSCGKDEWLVAICCKPWYIPCPLTNEDDRKKVLYSAKLYIHTSDGIQCVIGSGHRRYVKCNAPKPLSKYRVGTVITENEIPQDKRLRVSAVVQFIEKKA